MKVHYGLAPIHIVNPVVTMGSFDGVHKGHRQVIDGLKRCAEKLEGETVIITFDPHPREVLYPLEKRPGILTTLKEKIQILSFYGIDHLIVLKFTEELAGHTYSDFVKHILVDRMGIKGLVVGYDHRFGKDRKGNFNTLKELAEKYHFYIEQENVYTCDQVNISSTKIRTALELGDIAKVKEFLGYDYTISGTVVHGDKIGKKVIGFPTANLKIDDERKLLPAVGGYVVRVLWEEKVYYGMLNVGVRPTVSPTAIIRLEVNIFDFEGDLYGKEMKVQLLSRIRGEHKFDTIDELRLQLQKDKITAQHFLEKDQLKGNI